MCLKIDSNFFVADVTLPGTVLISVSMCIVHIGDLVGDLVGGGEREENRAFLGEKHGRGCNQVSRFP